MTLAEHLNPFFTRHVEITCPLRASECASRLRDDLARPWAFWGTRENMKGRVTEERFWLRRYAGGGKALPSQASGSFAPDVHGTRLDMTIGWRRADVIVMLVAVLAVTLFFWGMSLADPRTPAWLSLVFVPIFVISAVMHRASTLHDDEWLVAHLCELLGGREVSGTAA